MDAELNTAPMATEEVVAQEETLVEETAEQVAAPMTKESIVEQFRTLLEQPVNEIREQAEVLKSHFYRIYRQEQELARQAWEKAKEAGEEALDEFKPQVDAVEQQFHELLNTYKEKRAEAHAKADAEMKQNQLRKENIIEQMKELSGTDTADVNDNLKRVKELQQEWKTIGAVPPEVANTLWKQYNLYQEKFYDLVKINFELREYDFRKNLEMKTALCEQAEKLAEREDIVPAFKELQRLHEEWANIGPVAREQREEIWNRFKAASTVINKRHQDYFAGIHEQENINLQLKQNLIEEVKQIDIAALNTNKLWDEATEKITEIQTKWRAIGFAPKKYNQQIYDEYRKLCDNFFNAKNEFYKQLKDSLSQNLQLKRELVRKAEELKESQDWKNTTEKIIALQKQWKTVGAVARKHSDEVWKQFTAACDYFFEQKKAALKDTISEEKQNLEKKRAIIKQIEEIAIDEKDAALSQLRQLMAQYNAVGFVPFREKDKVAKQFHAATDRIFDQLNIDAANRRLDAFTKEVESKDENALLNDRRRLVRQYEALQQDIKTAENNILFFTANSKKSGKLIEDMQHKITAQKKQLAELEQRINLIDSKLG